METVKRGCVVKSAAGHDSDMLFIVTGFDDTYAYLCDGKIRPVEKPKKKKLKHLRFYADEASERLTSKLENGTKIENAEIRKALTRFIIQEVV